MTFKENDLNIKNSQIKRPFGRIYRWVLKVFFISILVLTGTMSAQAELDERFEVWNLFFITGPLIGNLHGYLEIQPRFTLVGEKNHRLLLRPALKYRLNQQVSVWAGYGWTPIFQPQFRNENRLWQQFQYETHLGEVEWIFRTRFEERWIQNTAGPSETAYRLRQWVRSLWPTSIEWLRFAATDEVFIHLNTLKKGPHSGLDQNRLFLGGLFRVSPMVSIETGYLNNYVWREGTDRLNHVMYSFFMYKI